MSITSTKQKGAAGFYVGATIVGLLAALALASAGTAFWAYATQRDDGYVTTASHVYGTPARAIVTEGVTVGNDVPDWLLGKIRIEAASTSGRPLFVGIAKQSDVTAYLAGVRYAKITKLDLDPFAVTYTPQPGREAPAKPAAQAFWAASAQGSGTQALKWKVQEGNWSIVVMNTDGSAGVSAEIQPGASFPAALWVAIGVAVAGGLLTWGTIALIVAGARRGRRNGPRAAPTVAAA